MIEIQRILCPVDFSACSRRALDYAVVVARRFESTVTMLFVSAVVPIDAYAPGTVVLPTAVLTPNDRDQLLASMARFADAEGGASVAMTYKVAEGDVAARIVERAGTSSSDLLVMGTHGRSGFDRFLFGSVTDKVLRKATCPVLTVPPRVPDMVPADPALFKRIVCAVDFSDCSMYALEYAMSLAQEADAQLTVVHVIEVPPALPPHTSGDIFETPRSLREYIALAEEDRRARLERAIPDSVRSYCAVDLVLVTGKAYRELLRVASERSADLLIAGVQGRGAANLLFFGSTAQHLVRQASCPVLTLRKG